MLEPSCSQIVPFQTFEFCQVCGQKGHGKHFGAVTCRACAVFFRRSIAAKKLKKCENGSKCIFLKNGYFNCKKCRLQKCREVGMTEENFQFNRDPLSAGSHPKSSILRNVPPTMSTLLGRPNLIIYVAPEEGIREKTFVDVTFLLESAARILLQGAETPMNSKNRLKKLADGRQLISGKTKKQVKVVTKVERDDILYSWEEEMKKAAKWLTYFDEFQKLDHDLQVEMLKSTWRVWTRLDRMATTAMGRRQKAYGKGSTILWNSKDEHLVCGLSQVEVDMSWCTKYSLGQLKVFEEAYSHGRMDQLIEMFLNLDPSDEEMSYMLAQLCFHYVAKRHGGEIERVAEHLQESIANDLHEYYVNELKMSNYSGRIAKMMKVNNFIQEDIQRGRARSVIARVFELFHVEFSHPEMFVDF